LGYLVGRGYNWPPWTWILARLVRYLGCADNTGPPVYTPVSERRKRKITEISADLN